MLSKVSSNQLFFLGISFLHPIYHGLLYFWIANYLPVLVPLTFVLSIVLFYLLNLRIAFHLTIRIWAIYLVAWSVIRMLMALALYASPSVTESHIRDQLTLLYFLINIALFYIAYRLFLISVKTE